MSVHADDARQRLSTGLAAVRARTLALTAGWTGEDQCVQSMPDASPVKWHLAHTSWFFEAMVLQPLLAGYRCFDERYLYLFNSYYEALGPRHARPSRGLLTRPGLPQVHAYRAHVDAALAALAETASEDLWQAAAPLLTLGLNHEQQHQELMLTDLLHAFLCNPLLPAVFGAGEGPALSGRPHAAVRWIAHPGGLVTTGFDGSGFAFDNEGPRHEVMLAPFEMAADLVRCGDYLAFVEDGGYRRPGLWLSEGWATVQAQGWSAPACWLAPGDRRAPSDAWQVFGLQGVRPLDPLEPVSQLSFYEAAAYAEWAGARLPTEFEWEAAAALPGLQDLTGQVWQWTRSSYDPYPGFRAARGAVGEYNGKFMVGQLVLRGGSVATPPGHTRATYRNFFPPSARWQFSGVRLARQAVA